MKLFLSVLSATVILVIDAVQFIMLIHAILSWVFPGGGKAGPIRAFIDGVCELVTAPMRALLDRFEFTRRSPIDFSFLFTFIALSLLSTILSVL